MADYKSVYETNFTNANIAAAASETFLSNNADRAQVAKAKQSFNALEIYNTSALILFIDFDGLTTRRRKMFGNSALIIKPEENLFFNTIKITNGDAALQADATLIQGQARILKEVTSPVRIIGA